MRIMIRRKQEKRGERDFYWREQNIIRAETLEKKKEKGTERVGEGKGSGYVMV